MSKIKFLSIVLLLAAMNITAQTWQIGFPPNAAAVTASLNNGTLTVSGNGAMKDWWYDAPWSDIGGNITNVVIYDGVTNIGITAFAYCPNLTSVSIPGSVQTIGSYAFWVCGLRAD